jgi:hypothetical protein
MAGHFLGLPGCFVADPGGKVGGTRQASGALQGGDARLVVGEPPDASDRLKQADEEQIVDPRMHHVEYQYTTLLSSPAPAWFRRAGRTNGFLYTETQVRYRQATGSPEFCKLR